MDKYFLIIIFLVFIIIYVVALLSKKDRQYISSKTVSTAYDQWTDDGLLELLWGEHIHLGYYEKPYSKINFIQAKIEFVHQLVQWTGLDQLPKGSRVLDVGCGIGGSARILAKDYGFDVLGISISPAQINRARELTPEGVNARFEVMEALDLKIPNGSFDAVWSVEAGPHMDDKQLYADEMLRVLRPGGVLAVADWNKSDLAPNELNKFENWIMHQLRIQWAHPHFASINSFKNNLQKSTFSGGEVDIEDWTCYTLPSWNDSIFEGIRRFKDISRLGINFFFKGFREIPTILLMRWAFANGLMKFGVFRGRG